MLVHADSQCVVEVLGSIVDRRHVGAAVSKDDTIQHAAQEVRKSPAKMVVWDPRRISNTHVTRQKPRE